MANASECSTSFLLKSFFVSLWVGDPEMRYPAHTPPKIYLGVRVDTTHHHSRTLGTSQDYPGPQGVSQQGEGDFVK